MYSEVPKPHTPGRGSLRKSRNGGERIKPRSWLSSPRACVFFSRMGKPNENALIHLAELRSLQILGVNCLETTEDEGCTYPAVSFTALISLHCSTHTPGVLPFFLTSNLEWHVLVGDSEIPSILQSLAFNHQHPNRLHKLLYSAKYSYEALHPRAPTTSSVHRLTNPVH